MRIGIRTPNYFLAGGMARGEQIFAGQVFEVIFHFFEVIAGSMLDFLLSDRLSP